MKLLKLAVVFLMVCGLATAIPEQWSNSKVPIRPIEIVEVIPAVENTRFTHCQDCMPTECGRARSSFLESRVYGGRKVPRGRHPWIVMLTDAKKNGSLVGSGVLISCNLVVTSAYNVGRFSQVSDIRARLGATNVNERQDGEMQFRIRKAHVHPQWNSLESLFAHDVAVLQLNGAVNFDETNGYIAPICVPSRDEDYGGWLAVAGFGENLNGTNNGQLQEADIFKLPKEECKLFAGQEFAFCGLGNNKGLCNGDRGSPAVRMEADGRYSLAAIANDYQCWPGGSDVYTTAPDFVDWMCTLPIV